MRRLSLSACSRIASWMSPLVIGIIGLVIPAANPSVVCAGNEGSPAVSVLEEAPASHNQPACIGDEPRIVFDCFVRAYNGRNSEALAGLFSEDFSREHPEGGASWGRAKELETTKAMLESDAVSSVQMSFDLPSAVPGPDAGTWIFEKVSTRVVVEAIEGEETRTFTADTGATQNIYVRSVPGGGFQIYRWVDARTD
ncbi:MAG: hypothetical protein R3E97_11135 [Candidatus Eisenbacteria bacterium]